MKKNSALILAAMLLSGCGVGPGNSSHYSSLAGHHFVLKSVDGQKIIPPAGMKPGISFAQDMNVSGVMCNRFFGQGKLERDMLTVPHLASTRMMCSDPALNQWEAIIGKMLVAGVLVQRNQHTLTLSGSGHTLVYTDN